MAIRFETREEAEEAIREALIETPVENLAAFQDALVAYVLIDKDEKGFLFNKDKEVEGADFVEFVMGWIECARDYVCEFYEDDNDES